MNENLSYNISYDSMKKIIANYFMQQGKNVDVRISNEIDTDRFSGMVTTSIQVIEKSTIAGIESKTKKYLSLDDIKEITDSALKLEGKELIDLTNNAVSTNRIKGEWENMKLNQ